MRSWMDSDKKLLRYIAFEGCNINLKCKIHHNLATASGLFFMNSKNYGIGIHNTIKLKNLLFPHWCTNLLQICYKLSFYIDKEACKR